MKYSLNSSGVKRQYSKQPKFCLALPLKNFGYLALLAFCTPI